MNFPVSVLLSLMTICLCLICCKWSPASAYGLPNVLANNGPAVSPIGLNPATYNSQPPNNAATNQASSYANSYSNNGYTKDYSNNLYSLVIEQQTCDQISHGNNLENDIVLNNNNDGLVDVSETGSDSLNSNLVGTKDTVLVKNSNDKVASEVNEDLVVENNNLVVENNNLLVDSVSQEQNNLVANSQVNEKDTIDSENTFRSMKSPSKIIKKRHNVENNISDFNNKHNSNNQQHEQHQCQQIGAPNLYVSTSRSNYAIVSSELALNGWLAASVNGNEVFIVTLRKTVQTGNLEALDPIKKKLLEKVRLRFIRNTQGLVLNNDLTSDFDQTISTDDFIRNANDGLSLPSTSLSGLSSNPFNGVSASANNRGNAPLVSLGQSDYATTQSQQLSSSYNNNNNNKAGNRFWCSKTYYQNLASSTLNNTLDGDVYYFDSYGNQLNILSNTVSTYCREEFSIVYRDQNYFAYSRVNLASTGFDRFFVSGGNVFLIYTDGSVLAKPTWALETGEFNAVLRARTEVKRLIGVQANEELANARQIVDPKLVDIANIVQSLIKKQQLSSNKINNDHNNNNDLFNSGFLDDQQASI